MMQDLQLTVVPGHRLAVNSQRPLMLRRAQVEVGDGGLPYAELLARPRRSVLLMTVATLQLHNDSVFGSRAIALDLCSAETVDFVMSTPRYARIQFDLADYVVFSLDVHLSLDWDYVLISEPI